MAALKSYFKANITGVGVIVSELFFLSWDNKIYMTQILSRLWFVLFIYSFVPGFLAQTTNH